jgi:hypothetical protein
MYVESVAVDALFREMWASPAFLQAGLGIKILQFFDNKTYEFISTVKFKKIGHNISGSALT